MSKDILDLPDRRSAHDPQKWLRELRGNCSIERKEALREKLGALDSGRFWGMLDETHALVSLSDRPQYQAFRENYSDWLFKWVQVFGYCEDLATFETRE